MDTPNSRARTAIRTAALAVAVVLSVLAAGGTALAAAPDEADAVETFRFDVYWVDPHCACLRNPTSETPLDAGLYTADGTAMGITWERFRSVTATSQMKTMGGPSGPRTDVRVELAGLLPGGVYSLFYATFVPDTVNPACPNVERLLPLPAFRVEDTQPDPASFVADAAGTVSFHSRVEGDLLAATQVLVQLIYHFDGHTYGDVPTYGENVTRGPECRTSYGHDAMRQTQIIQKG
jgi:hypothetical protein